MENRIKSVISIYEDRFKYSKTEKIFTQNANRVLIETNTYYKRTGNKRTEFKVIVNRQIESRRVKIIVVDN